MSHPIILPLFGGQGLATAVPSSDYYSTVPFNASPSGTLLLESCHAVLLEEIACLKAEDLDHLGICAQDYSDQNTVIYPLKTAHRNDPVFSGTILLLDQALRFLAYINNISNPSPSSKPILDALRCSPNNTLGITGLSSGILTACVVASSPSIPSFILHCVEAYRLALWIGIRSKLHQISSTSSYPLSTTRRPWSLVLIGMDKSDILYAIQAYHTVS